MDRGMGGIDERRDGVIKVGCLPYTVVYRWVGRRVDYLEMY